MTTRILASVGSVRANSGNGQLADSDDNLPREALKSNSLGVSATW